MNKTLIADCRIYKESADKLTQMGYKIISVKSQPFLEEPVSSHPDMLCTKLLAHLFVASEIAEYFINKKNIISCSREESLPKPLTYPYDIAFNCVQIGNKLLCNEKYTHKNIIDFAIKNGIQIINVNQGYAKCSTCVVSDNAIITEDESIYNAAKVNGIDTLIIRKGYVKLIGYDYGFIGGCSGLCDKNKLFFNGCIEEHPDYEKILNHCKCHGTTPISLSDKPLYDIGSIIEL